MGKEKVDAKTGEAESPEAEKGLVEKLTKAVSDLTDKVSSLTERQEKQDAREEKRADLWKLLFGGETEEKH